MSVTAVFWRCYIGTHLLMLPCWIISPIRSKKQTTVECGGMLYFTNYKGNVSSMLDSIHCKKYIWYIEYSRYWMHSKVQSVHQLTMNNANIILMYLLFFLMWSLWPQFLYNSSSITSHNIYAFNYCPNLIPWTCYKCFMKFISFHF
jgi:hypothetical protein